MSKNPSERPDPAGSFIPPLPLRHSLLLFGLPAVYFLIIAYGLIPYLVRGLGFHPALGWFVGGLCVFIPLFVLSLVLCRRDGVSLQVRPILDRLRIRPLSRRDWIITGLSLGAIFLLTGIIMLIAGRTAAVLGIPPFKTSPPFMEFEPLRGNQRFLLFVWFPMFFFNILGEEMLWRGYILPRQEAEHGRRAWMVNAGLWLLFHLSFGPFLILLLLPILVILPWAAQKTGNTSTALVIHGLMNGPMFVLVALGLIG